MRKLLSLLEYLLLIVCCTSILVRTGYFGYYPDWTRPGPGIGWSGYLVASTRSGLGFQRPKPRPGWTKTIFMLMFTPGAPQAVSLRLAALLVPKDCATFSNIKSAEYYFFPPNFIFIIASFFLLGGGSGCANVCLGNQSKFTIHICSFNAVVKSAWWTVSGTIRQYILLSISTGLRGGSNRLMGRK
jgi:hypothetical protein